MELLQVKNLKKTYSTKLSSNTVTALKDVSFSVNKGEFISIMGESGSGKTTLLNILASLDKKTSGEVLLDGNDLSFLKEAELARFRRESLGFVFQEFNLLDTLNTEENIILPLILSHKNQKEIKTRLERITNKLGIQHLLKKYPHEISGGEKQRVAVARAVITEPKLLLADEPTGALDSKSTDILLSEFNKINQDGQTILMVTHSIKTATYSSRVLFIKDGVVFHQIYKGRSNEKEFFSKISDTLTMLQNGGEIGE